MANEMSRALEAFGRFNHEPNPASGSDAKVNGKHDVSKAGLQTTSPHRVDSLRNPGGFP